MPLPSFSVTGNLNDIPGANLAGELVTTAWTAASLRFTDNTRAPHIVLWDGELYRLPRTVTVYVSDDGSISDEDNPVLLLANDAGLNVTGLQWTVEIVIGNGVVASWPFDAPDDGGTVDLGTVAHAPGVTATAAAGLTEAQLLALIADSDSNIHDAIVALGGGFFDLPGTTHAATGKTTPVNADELPLVDSAASNGLKKLTWANLKATILAAVSSSGSAATLTTPRNIDGQSFNGSAAITVIAPGTHAATGKTTPVAADEIPLVDSAATNVLKKLTWANLMATVYAGHTGVKWAKAPTGTAATDTANLQDAIDDVQADGGGDVCTQGGIYSVTPDSLAVDPAGGAVTLIGAGRGVTILKKSNNGILLDVSGSATGFSTHCHNFRLSNIDLDGNAKTGALLRAYYADQMAVDNARLVNNVGRCVDGAELWDSRFDNVAFDCQSDTEPAVHLRAAAAASGFGFSADNTNNIRFNACRWESFQFGALHMEPGFGASGVQSIYVTNSKMESLAIRGDIVYAHGQTEDIHFDKLFIYGGGFDSGFSTPVRAIAMATNNSASLRDIYVACGATQVFWNVLSLYTDVGPMVIDNIDYRGGADPGNSVVFFEGSPGVMQVGSVTTTGGPLFAGTPTGVLGSRPLSRATAASASSLTPSLSSSDLYAYTALAANLAINAPTGIAIDGQPLEFRIKDNGTSRTLTWNAAYRAIGVTLPTATTIGKTVYVRGRYNAADSKVDVVDVKQEA